ncbi:MAG TPA: hypothetical protein DCG47_13590 [Spirochaetaceae bacterium]|jgi:hypothetical protein|nr:hypothetical protein [Spirochaetaceae bacterium]
MIEVKITERNFNGKPNWKVWREGGNVALVYSTKPEPEHAAAALEKAEKESETHEWLYGDRSAAPRTRKPAAAYTAPAALPGDSERQEASLAAGMELASFFKAMPASMTAQERYARVASAEFEALCARAGISPEPFRSQFRAVCLSPSETRLFQAMGMNPEQFEAIALGRV